MSCFSVCLFVCSVLIGLVVVGGVQVQIFVVVLVVLLLDFIGIVQQNVVVVVYVEVKYNGWW